MLIGWTRIFSFFWGTWVDLSLRSSFWAFDPKEWSGSLIAIESASQKIVLDVFMHTLAKDCSAKHTLLYMLSICCFFLASCIRSVVLVQGGIFYIVFWLRFCQFYDCSGEGSNRAQEIGHRAAIVGGLTSRYRSSFFGDGESVRIWEFSMAVYHPSFGETGTSVPSRSRLVASSSGISHRIVLRARGVSDGLRPNSDEFV